jgi:hypothetical protein
MRPYFPLTASVGFRITVSPGLSIKGSDVVTLFTRDVQGLQNVLAECKRLKLLTGTYNRVPRFIVLKTFPQKVPLAKAPTRERKPTLGWPPTRLKMLISLTVRVVPH